MITEDWGLIDFDKAFAKQKEYVAQIAAGKREDTLVFCHHPPTVTKGRKTESQDIFDWQGPTFEVNRGGRATYHGPNQMVVYPLIHLNSSEQRSFAPKDIHAYLRFLEQVILKFLRVFEVEAEVRELHPVAGEDRSENATGAWVKDKKIASIGIAIQKWVTSHGVAINLYEDSEAFKGINPCGFKIEQITNLESITKKSCTREFAQSTFAQCFLSIIKSE